MTLAPLKLPSLDAAAQRMDALAKRTQPKEPTPAPMPVASYWQDQAAAAARRQGIDEHYFVAQIGAESGWDEDVIAGRRVSSAGAKGIAQFMDPTARQYGVDPLKPLEALDGAARYMADNLRQFGGDVRAAAAAYNAGGGTVAGLQKRYGSAWEAYLPGETKQYLSRIFGSASASAAPATPGGPQPSFVEAMQGGTATASAEDQRPPYPWRIENDAGRRQLLETETARLDEDSRDFALRVYEDAMEAGGSASEAYHRFKLSLREVGGNIKAVGPLQQDLSSNPALAAFQAAGGTFELAGEALATGVEAGIGRDLPAPVRRGVSLLPAFAVGPGGVVGPGRIGLKAGTALTASSAAASAVGGEATEAAGLGRGVGEFVGPIVPGVAGGIAQAARGRAKGAVLSAAGDAATPSPRPTGPTGPMDEGQAVLSLRQALREGKGAERIDIVKRGRAEQARRIEAALETGEIEGLSGIELARAAGKGGAGKILPDDGIGFRLPQEATDPLIEKAFRLHREGKMSVFEATYGVAKALDEGRRLGPTPAQAKLLSKLTAIDEVDFAPYVRQRNVFDAASREGMKAELAGIGVDSPASVRTQLQAARRAELLAERADALGKSDQAVNYRTKAAEHRAKAEAAQARIDATTKQQEIRRLVRQLDAETVRMEKNAAALAKFRAATVEANAKALDDYKATTLKRQAKIEQQKSELTRKLTEATQEAFDRSQFQGSITAAKQSQEISQRLIAQMAPPDMTANRVWRNAYRELDAVSTKTGMPREQLESALEILRYHTLGNRYILDSMKNAEGLGQSMAGVRATLTGELADSYLTALVTRNHALGHALIESGIDPDTARRVSNAAMNYELRLRFKGEPPQRILDELGTMKSASYEESLKGLELFVQRFKNVMFSIDAGVFGVQVRTAIRRGGINMLAGMINKQLAALHLPHVNTHTMAGPVLAKRLRNIVDGVHVGGGQSPVRAEAGTLLSYAGPRGRAIDQRYVQGVMDRINKVQFDNVMGWAGDSAYEGNLVMLHLLGRDIKNPRVRATAADSSNAIKSFGTQALRSGRAGKERTLFTSASMTRAGIANIMQMSKVFRPGASAEERMLGATLIASQAAYLLLVGKFLNDQMGVTDFVFNPGASGFGQVVTPFKDAEGRNRTIDMVPQASVEKAIARSFQELAEGNEVDAADAWLRYFGGRSSVVGGGLLGIPGLGYSSGPGGGFAGTTAVLTGEGLSPRDRLLNFAPLPPWLESVIVGGEDIVTAAIDFAGVSSYPESLTSLRNRESRQLFGKDYADLELTSQRQQVDALPNVQGTREARPPTGYTQARDRRLDAFTEEQGQIENAFAEGTLSRPLPELMRDLRARRYQTLQDLREDNKKLFDSFKGGPHDATLEGFYGIGFKNPDGTMDWERTIPARERYIASLPREERTWIEDFLGVQESKKSQLERDVASYNDERERLGYYEKDADTRALDRANPKIDVQTWLYYGGVRDKERNPDPVLQSPEAVKAALALDMPGRDIKLDGVTRPINQTPQTIEAWEYSGAPVWWMQEGIVEQNGDREAQRLYKKPYAELTSEQQGSVKGNLRTAARKSDAQLDAWMVWWGNGKLHSRAAGEILKQIMARYGNAPPKADFVVEYVQNAR